MLKERCPYHEGGANHKLEDYCVLKKKYFDSLGIKRMTRGRIGAMTRAAGMTTTSSLRNTIAIYGGPST